MNRKVYFCKSWFRAKKIPIEIWSIDRARVAHESKKFYTALIDSPERPFCFLEITEKAVGVGFLDEKLRESLTYGFQEVAPRKLFLTMATYREFDGDADKILKATSYIFNQNGAVEIRREFYSPRSLETSVSSGDLSKNYAAVPEFGEYDDLIRIERI